MTLRSRQEAALEPVQSALISSTASEAARAVAKARSAAAALLAHAATDADDAVAQAAAAGAAQARLVGAAQLTRSRRAARSVVLGAELDIYQYLAGRVRAAVLALSEDNDYPALRRWLAEMARHAAGPGARVTDHPDGGVVARAPGVVVDCSLGRLADWAIAALDGPILALCRQPGPPSATDITP